MIPISAGTYLKAGTLALVLGAVFFGGRSCGVDAEKASTKAAEALSAKKSDALKSASRSFKAFAKVFRAYNEIAASEAQRAARMLRAGEDAAKQAREDAAQTKIVVGHLKKQLEAERSGCVDGERPICGIPLR